jgi:hypothetical protein
MDHQHFAIAQVLARATQEQRMAAFACLTDDLLRSIESECFATYQDRHLDDPIQLPLEVAV